MLKSLIIILANKDCESEQGKGGGEMKLLLKTLLVYIPLVSIFMVVSHIEISFLGCVILVI